MTRKNERPDSFGMGPTGRTFITLAIFFAYF